ncbi:hypothetical protein BX264_3892 [Streptomyces sp. 2333.5]|nr:hypothetical protein BX264_3892 [Streptomyces sp. 2333.5]SED37095.1 hypothetical protein SAMN05428943_3492 [Streptomyces sp. 2314.4]SEE48199.1 hypothetical protein SAMN05428942_3995 [Streptomyces sp. 2112.2]
MDSDRDRDEIGISGRSSEEFRESQSEEVDESLRNSEGRRSFRNPFARPSGRMEELTPQPETPLQFMPEAPDPIISPATSVGELPHLTTLSVDDAAVSGVEPVSSEIAPQQSRPETPTRDLGEGLSGTPGRVDDRHVTLREALAGSAGNARLDEAAEREEDDGQRRVPHSVQSHGGDPLMADLVPGAETQEPGYLNPFSQQSEVTDHETDAQDAAESSLPRESESTSFTGQNYGSGPFHQAVNQEVNNFWKGDFVRQVAIPRGDLAACSEHRFVAPRDPGQLEEASRHLASQGVVILSASPGNGRRTAALRLLNTLGVTPRPLELFDLEPEWSKPSIERLPKIGGQGYILDLSELPEGDPDGRFGRDLANYGNDGRKKGWFLVILASPKEWKGAWVEPTLEFTVGLSSPDAKVLVKSELRARSSGDRVEWLDDPVFTGIWQSNPPAQESRRLARIIAEAKQRDLAKIVDEFRGWHDHIEGLLNRREPRGQGDPSLLSMRATVWAGALLHGGQFRSVLKAADALLEDLEISRASAEVLADATSSRRLAAAKISTYGEQAFHEQDKHDLAPAILQNLWEEFPTQRELLRSWAVSVAADLAVPEEDARRVTKMLLHLATVRRDGDILDSIGTGLVGRRRQLAVEALTAAALDSQIGAYVRHRLYLWARNPSSEETIKLVTEVCGGELGVKKPGIALTRLRWAAGQSPFGSRPVTEAIRRLVEARPAEVREAIGVWLDDEKLRIQALVVFLALASSESGAAFLLRNAEEESDRRRFVEAWQQLLTTEDAREAVDSQLTKWGELADRGALRRDALVDLLADVYEPAIYRNGLSRFFADGSDFVESFWGQVLTEAIVRSKRRREGRTE